MAFALTVLAIATVAAAFHHNFRYCPTFEYKVIQGTSQDADGLKSKFDEFRNALGGNDNDSTPEPLKNGFREIIWDGGAPFDMLYDLFNRVAPLGAISTKFFRVSGTNCKASVSGFGAVYVDVDNKYATLLGLYDDRGCKIAIVPVPTRNTGLNFVSIRVTGIRHGHLRKAPSTRPSSSLVIHLSSLIATAVIAPHYVLPLLAPVPFSSPPLKYILHAA